MYDKHFDETLIFINTYQKLINCHVVDFITENLWETCLPDTLRLELERDDTNDVLCTETSNYPAFNNFLQLTKSLSLKTCSIEVNSKDFSNMFPNVHTWSICKCKSKKAEFMNAKKLHEVESLGNFIGTLAASIGNLVIDAGAGKAYLSTFIAENYKLPVLAIDSSQICGKGAICKKKKFTKGTMCSDNLVQYVVEEISEKTDYVKMIKENFCDWNLNKNLILTGLHTCGSLTHSAIKTFLSTKDIIYLCIVPCCYHLTNETFNEKINFSKNARMLAQQSIERSTRNKCLSSTLFYRAVLQALLHSMGIYNARVGRGGPLYSFPSYAQWAFAKLGIKSEKVPSVDSLEGTYQSYIPLMKKFHMFQLLRVHTGTVLEAAITLDRVTFLLKNNQCSNVATLRLFDPILSPRHYGIFAIKSYIKQN